MTDVTNDAQVQARSLTPVQRTRLRHAMREAAKRAEVCDPHGGAATNNVHDLLLAQLVEHRRRLKDVQSIERKIEAKRVFLPTYDAWIDATLTDGSGAADPIITTMLIWHIDVGLYERALRIAQYAARYDMRLPDQYERTLAVALIDEFAVAALTGRMTAEQAAQLLPRVMSLTDDSDAPDQARAKLHKALGFALLGKVGQAEADLASVDRHACADALQHLRRALSLWDQVGVKKDVERLERRLKSPDPATDPVTHPVANGAASNTPA